jgi:hypothetical protein
MMTVRVAVNRRSVDVELGVVDPYQVLDFEERSSL